MSTLFTIGYATKEIEEFIRLLKSNGINCLVDVRTSPYSKQFPDYNKESLELTLKAHNIVYLHFGEEFGARRIEETAYTRELNFIGEEHEYVDFRKVQELSAFKRGCERITNGVKRGYTICFMCSEKYPYDCHRAILVGNWFYNNGYLVKHIIDLNNSILHDKMLQSNEQYKYFQKCKAAYQKKYEHSYDLLGNQNGTVEFLTYWDKFFNQYDDQKLIYLLNLKIGYKKGEDNND